MANLRSTFENKYDRALWQTILKEYFGAKVIYEKPIPVEIKNNDYKATAVELGSFETKEKYIIGIYEIDLPTNKVNLFRNKKTIRDLLSLKYKNDVDGALIVFKQDSTCKWRFSYVTELKQNTTNWKRFTYLLGEGERCKTASDRFEEIKSITKSKNILPIKALNDAFSVEKMSEDFFNQYRQQYGEFTKMLTGLDENGKGSGQAMSGFTTFFPGETEKAKKTARDFVKKMMGRIVFLYFLEKKGWLGVPENENWGDGDPYFLSNLFRDAKNQEKFYSQILVPLFFETLNAERPKDLFNIKESVFKSGDYNKTKIPYLNGGLFHNDLPKTNNLEFNNEAKLFGSLFEFLDQYNFTVDEDLEKDHTVAVDPEMLGHIFENLLEDNKDKGAFYTPKEIVHYMCQESLTEYLHTTLVNNYGIIDPNLKQQIAEFLKEDDREKVGYHGKIAKALKDVKICDPAIGSGAFPMGLLHEIFEAINSFRSDLDVKEVWGLEGDDFDRAKIKAQIIQNSIYGVDLEKGAVDIARLRFWLSLIVDEVEPKALPNLDFKIMQGNSLLESFGDIDLSVLPKKPKTKGQGTMDFGDDEKGFSSKDISALKKLIATYFNESDKKKKEVLEREIQKIVHEFIKAKIAEKKKQLDQELEEEEAKLVTISRSTATTPAAKAKKEKALKTQKTVVKDLLAQMEDLNNQKVELMEMEKTGINNFFLWHIWFSDVFENGGFDIVIGNPPYIQLQKMGKDCDDLAKANYETFARTGDIYCLFYEKGNTILRPSGLLSYITSNTWMRTKFGEHLRKYFVEKTNPLYLLNFEDSQIFKTATVEANIIFTKREEFVNDLLAVVVNKDYKIDSSIRQYFNENKIHIDELPEEGWVILTKPDFLIKKQISSKGKQLKNWEQIEFYRGFLTGFNDAFFIDEKKRAELIKKDNSSREIIKPLLRGREIKKYSYTFNDNYVIFSHNGLKENKKKGIEEIPRINVVKDYKEIYKHLQLYKDIDSPLAKENKDGTWQTLVDRADQGEHWTNLRDCAYQPLFEKPKLIWLAITDKPAFAYDESHYVTAPAYFLSGSSLKYLLCVLNSRCMEWYLDKVSSSTGQGTNQWSKIFVEQLPIPIIEDESKLQKFEVLADYLTFLCQENSQVVSSNISNAAIFTIMELLANMMVYELYFEEHMKELDIDVLKYIDIAKIFKPIESTKKSAKSDAAVILEAYNWLSKKENNVMKRISQSKEKSPEIIERISNSTH